MLAPLPDQTAQDTNSALADLTRTIENLCLQGDAYACVQRGFMVPDKRKWRDTANTVKQARYAELVAACASGDNVACGQGATLAIKLQLPQRKDAEPHYTMLAKACVGAEHSCDNLAFTLRGFARGDTQAKALFAQGIAALETACNMGNLPACGAHFHALPIRALNKQALLDKACISGHAKSCAERATRAYSAYTRDLENIALLQSATEDFTTACALGHQIACHTLEHLSKG
ncbi:MAG: hypothetical protein ABJJ09_00055 [Ascidiaceihabitans sp.]|uniref:hypothetical protein n=1 Tax=Ascidiaceihabitans sp. TaxID=1872644 RepID=UPI00329A2114